MNNKPSLNSKNVPIFLFFFLFFLFLFFLQDFFSWNKRGFGFNDNAPSNPLWSREKKDRCNKREERKYFYSRELKKKKKGYKRLQEHFRVLLLAIGNRNLRLPCEKLVTRGDIAMAVHYTWREVRWFLIFCWIKIFWVGDWWTDLATFLYFNFILNFLYQFLFFHNRNWSHLIFEFKFKIFISIFIFF